MLTLHRNLSSTVREILLPELKDLKDKRMALDSYWFDLKSLFRLIQRKRDEFITKFKLKDQLKLIVERLLYNQDYQIKYHLKDDPRQTAKESSSTIKYADDILAFIENNTEMIKSLDDRYLNEVRQIIINGINNSERV